MRPGRSVAAQVRLRKEVHPELYCRIPRCLWRTGGPSGTPCRKHPAPAVGSAPLTQGETMATTLTAQKITLTNADPDTGKTYTVDGLLLTDGRLLVRGAGVDGGDSLFAALSDYEANGNDQWVANEVHAETAPVTLDDLAHGDVDNLVYGESLLTAEEKAAVLRSDDRGCERWRKASER